ncbi:DsbA family protein [Parabacteroides goldsteinii]
MKKCILFFVILSISSCKENKDSIKSEIVATVNGHEILSVEIDKLIQQELFDELNKIYSIRNKALNTSIGLFSLNAEAKKKNKNLDDYINTYVDNKIKQIGIDSLYNLYNLENRIKLHGLSLENIKKESLENKLSIKYYLKEYITTDLIDSIKCTSEINNFLYPPKSPKIKLNDLLAYYRGNLNSKVSVYTISDFDCEKCIQAKPTIDSLYNKYKDITRFGYINFSAAPTLAQLACDAANNQASFWSFHDSLYSKKEQIDSVTVFNIAKNLNLNLYTFKKDLMNKIAADKINETINKLVEMGIYATPTIIVNGRLIYNSNSYNEISHLIELELNK